MFELVDSIPKNAEIKVIGIGGGGCNAVRHMMESNIDGVDFICANTDAQSLNDMSQATVLQLGGSGGGRPDFAQGGVENLEDVDIALSSVPELLLSLAKQ